MKKYRLGQYFKNFLQNKCTSRNLKDYVWYYWKNDVICTIAKSYILRNTLESEWFLQKCTAESHELFWIKNGALSDGPCFELEILVKKFNQIMNCGTLKFGKYYRNSSQILNLKYNQKYDITKGMMLAVWLQSHLSFMIFLFM